MKPIMLLRGNKIQFSCGLHVHLRGKSSVLFPSASCHMRNLSYFFILLCFWYQHLSWLHGRLVSPNEAGVPHPTCFEALTGERCSKSPNLDPDCFPSFHALWLLGCSFIWQNQRVLVTIIFANGRSSTIKSSFLKRAKYLNTEKTLATLKILFSSKSVKGVGYLTWMDWTFFCRSSEVLTSCHCLYVSFKMSTCGSHRLKSLKGWKSQI